MADVNKDEENIKKSKRKNACDLLADLCASRTYSLVGQYAYDESGQVVYVMEVEVDGKTYQGIGFSKKKARSMAAEYALLNKGKLEKIDEEFFTEYKEPYFWNDFTADLVDSNSALYFDFNNAAAELDEDDDDDENWMDSITFDVEDENRHLIGKNTLSILSELHPDTSYKMMSAIFDKQKIYFVMSTEVNGIEFKGSGPNKRLARARAAREALRVIYKMEFGVLEDGMPVYEGDEQIWRWYKKKLEERATRSDFSGTSKNPLKEIYDLYPDIKFSFPFESDVKGSNPRFVAQAVIDGDFYEAEGTNKKLARTNVAEVAIEALKSSGKYEKKLKEIEERKKMRDEKKQAEKPRYVPDSFRSAVSKLNEVRQGVEYRTLAETPLKNTCITAFTMGVTVDGKNYVGVGKNKRMAKLEVAEKVLRDLGAWSEEDEDAKNKLLQELLESDNFQENSYSFTSQKGPVDLMQLVQKDMTRKDMLKMVNTQLGLNLPAHLLNSDPDNRSRHSSRPDNFSAMLDELDMLVETILGQNQSGSSNFIQDFDSSRGPRHGPPSRLGSGPRPLQGPQYPRRNYDDRRDHGNTRSNSSQNWNSQNKSRFDNESSNRRNFDRNSKSNQNPPYPRQGPGFAPKTPNVPRNPPNPQPPKTNDNWYNRNNQSQWNQNQNWNSANYDASQQNPSNYNWPTSDNQNAGWSGYDQQYNNQASWGATESQFAAPPPPPPPPPPSAEAPVQYPGFNQSTPGYYSGQMGQTMPANYQGYDYSAQGYYNPWAYQNTDSGTMK